MKLPLQDGDIIKTHSSIKKISTYYGYRPKISLKRYKKILLNGIGNITKLMKEKIKFKIFLATKNGWNKFKFFNYQIFYKGSIFGLDKIKLKK